MSLPQLLVEGGMAGGGPVERVPGRPRDVVGGESVMHGVSPARHTTGAATGVDQVPEGSRWRGDSVVEERQVEKHCLRNKPGEESVVIPGGDDSAEQGGGRGGEN